MTELYGERVVQLGPAGSLVGIIADPVATIRRPDGPLVVILNAGIVHRVGPNRMSVILARSLARAGYSVLRFDMSSLGDSAPRTDNLPLLEASMADIRDVLDTLNSAKKVERVVLVGLCSGADHSVIYAGTDPRVVGIVLLDPSVPRTRGYYVRHISRQLLHVRQWRNLVGKGGRAWRALVQHIRRALGVGLAEPQVPVLERPEVRSFLQQAYARALAQGVQILVVLTGGVSRRHNYSGQLLDAFPDLDFGRQLNLEFFHEADHEFTTETSRQRLCDLVGDWLRAQKPDSKEV